MKDDPVTSTEEMELIQGHAWVAVHGIVTYQDIFSVNHWTKFCYEYNFAPFATKLSSLSCADYNDVDGEYQKQQSK
jgi:hypothetical protein